MEPKLPKLSKEEVLKAIRDGVTNALNCYPSQIQEAIECGVEEAFNISEYPRDRKSDINQLIYRAIKDGTKEALKEKYLKGDYK